MYFVIHNAGIVNFKFKEFEAAVKDLSACVKLEKDNKSAYTYLVGLFLKLEMSLGLDSDVGFLHNMKSIFSLSKYIL